MRFDQLRRREFITLLGGTAAAWPLAARAQQGERVRRIGMLLSTTSDDAEFQVRVGAFQQGLALAPVGWLLQATRSTPIVFVAVSDPIGFGFVASLARPGGNATGFMSYEFSIGVKWLELLKQIAPSLARVAVLRDPTQGSGSNFFAVIQAVAPLLRVEAVPVNTPNADEIESALAAFAQPP